MFICTIGGWLETMAIVAVVSVLCTLFGLSAVIAFFERKKK